MKITNNNNWKNWGKNEKWKLQIIIIEKIGKKWKLKIIIIEKIGKNEN